MAGNSGLLKRLEKLEQAIRVHRARFIVIEIDGIQEDQEAIDRLLKQLDVKSNDLVVEIKRYAKREGLPKVCGTSPL